MSKFHGLSSPEDLIETWRELKHDDDNNDINVIWEYEHPEQLKPGFNVVNILYDSSTPDEIGHYVLISVFPDKKLVEYFDPISSHTADNEDEIPFISGLFNQMNKRLAEVFIPEVVFHGEVCSGIISFRSHIQYEDVSHLQIMFT